MPLIDGYDDLDLGPKRFPEGEHTTTITKAATSTGKTKSGDNYYAFDVTIQAGDYTETVRLFLPQTTQEWSAWEDWQRKRCKKQLVGLSIHMSEIESETARANLIGKQQEIFVAKKQNGDGTNIYFRENTATDTGSGLPTPEQAQGGAPVTTTTTNQAPVLV